MTPPTDRLAITAELTTQLGDLTLALELHDLAQWGPAPAPSMSDNHGASRPDDKESERA